MKKFLSLLAVVLTLGLTTVAFDAEAKRLACNSKASALPGYPGKQCRLNPPRSGS